MNLSFKKFDNLLLYLSLKVGVHFMNSQHLRPKWHFEKRDKYGQIMEVCLAGVSLNIMAKLFGVQQCL